MSSPQERITPPGPLPDPIIGTDPASTPGIAQPVIVSGGQSLPPSLPAGTTFTSPGWGWLPPPQVGMGENEPFPTPPVPPGVMSPWPTQQPALPNQPIFVPPGSATAPTPAQLFPQFTTSPPMQPIVLNATQAAGSGVVFPDDWIAPPFPIPTTTGVQPITVGGWGLGAGPDGGGNSDIFPFMEEDNGADPFEPMKHMTENTFDPPPAEPPKPRAAPKRKTRKRK